MPVQGAEHPGVAGIGRFAVPDRVRELRAWGVALVGCAVLVVICIFFVDRPAARFAHDIIGRHAVFLEMTRIPEYMATAAAILAAVLGIVAWARGAIGGALRVLFAAALSFIVAQAIKDQLKFDFGRLWPETWVNHNPSFIDTGNYGFFPFHGGAGWGSFPSGHMTAITSAMAVLWMAWPRWRPLWAAAAVTVAVGLYGMDYHFVGDMVAGSFLGSAVGVGVARLNSIGVRA